MAIWIAGHLPGGVKDKTLLGSRPLAYLHISHIRELQLYNKNE